MIGNDDAIDLAVGYICEGDPAAVPFAEDNRSIADVLANFGMTSSCLSVLGRTEVLWEVGKWCLAAIRCVAADEGGQRYDCNDKCGESVVEELHGSVFVVVLVQFGLKRKAGLVKELDTAMALFICR